MTADAGSGSAGPPTLLLIGGGHAHIQVLESLARSDWPPVRTVLVSPHARQVYSGMVPGYLQGRYTAEEITIDLAGLCRAAGADFMEAKAESVAAATGEVRTTSGLLRFDLLSLDVGSSSQGLEFPGVKARAGWLESLQGLTALGDHLDRLATERADGRRVRVGVVGGGAGGVEVALALARRIRAAGGSPELFLIERGDRILPSYPDRGRRLAEAVIREAGGEVLPNREALAVDDSGIRFADDDRLPLDLTVWVGGAAPPPLLASTDLPLSDAGYFEVDHSLRASEGARVWGAGDCVDMVAQPLPKAGVYAVRQGSVLANNLRACLRGESPKPYRPQASFLSLLDTADGKAILRRGPVSLHNPLNLLLKKRIDRAFIRRFQSLVAA